MFSRALNRRQRMTMHVPPATGLLRGGETKKVSVYDGSLGCPTCLQLLTPASCAATNCSKNNNILKP